MKIEIVIPVFNEEENIPLVYKKINDTFIDIPNHNFEINFINDNSTDNTWRIIQELNDKDKNVKGTKLSRNFGHQAAIDAGISVFNSDALILMDGDLQDDPKYIIDFIKEWEKGSKVILAKRTMRKENIFRRIVFKLFFKIQKTVSDIDIPENVGHFSLLDKEVVETLKKFPEKVKYFNGLRSYLGFPTSYVEVVKNKREYGKTKMSFFKLFKLGLNGIFGFSTLPLTAIGVIGFLIAMFSFVVTIYSLYIRYTTGEGLLGWDFGLSSIYFLAGIQLLALSVLGKYIGIVFIETKSRPMYFIEDTID
mgnify:CR=1 FL=1|tara:strand:+ start:110 stop:1030 length:921 start_codon:yes stop_codon:yes gene_type:complete